MAFLSRATGDPEVLRLLVESGENAERAGLLLRRLLSDYPEHADLAGELVDREHEGDRITHDIILALNGRGRRRRGRLEPADGHALATALDDIVDYAEETADQLALYGVEAPMEQAAALGDVLVGACEQVAHALRCLRDGRDMTPHLVEIHRLENEGDRIERDGIASLFAGGIDPMLVIRWKDIYESLEGAVDACETVAHVLEGIALKRSRG